MIVGSGSQSAVNKTTTTCYNITFKTLVKIQVVRVLRDTK
jgi:hypothetical protein